METQAKHTPTPYKACKSHEDFNGPFFDLEEEDRAEYDAKPYTSIESASGIVCNAHDLFTFRQGDAEFIVKACNSYDKMRELLSAAYQKLYIADRIIDPYTEEDGEDIAGQSFSEGLADEIDAFLQNT